MEIIGALIFIFILLYGIFGFFRSSYLGDKENFKKQKTKIISKIIARNLVSYIFITFQLLFIAFNIYLLVIQILIHIFIYYLILFKNKSKLLNLLMIPILSIGLIFSYFGEKCDDYSFLGDEPNKYCNCKGLEICNIGGSKCIGKIIK